MPSSFPSTPDDLSRDNLTHGDVSDALAAVQTAVIGLLGSVAPQGPKGDKGDPGDTGPAGPAGADGTATLGAALDLDSTDDLIAAAPPAEGKVRLLLQHVADGVPPIALIKQSDESFAYLLTDSDKADFVGNFQFGFDKGSMVVGSGEFGSAPLGLVPGADGQVLTADSTSEVGLSYKDAHILTSPNGTAYRLIVADDGTLSTEPA